jgi:hypothetical protein
VKQTIGYIAAIILLLNACQSGSSSQVHNGIDSTKATILANQTSDILGTYQADFSGSPIFITINYCNGKNIAGYNVHKGLRRNLNGEIKQENNQWVVTLNEPGDHPFDGRFQLLFDADYQHGKGNWMPLNTPTLKEKTLQLSRVEKVGKEEDNFTAYLMNGETFTGNHCDITFTSDGSCTLTYYNKLTDSTFAPQMNVVRGTWEKKKEELHINWEKNEQFGKRNSVFIINFQSDENDPDKKYFNGIKGEGFEFWPQAG